jgi:hypothetical protein
VGDESEKRWGVHTGNEVPDELPLKSIDNILKVCNYIQYVQATFENEEECYEIETMYHGTGIRAGSIPWVYWR